MKNFTALALALIMLALPMASLGTAAQKDIYAGSNEEAISRLVEFSARLGEMQKRYSPAAEKGADALSVLRKAMGLL